MMKLKTLLFAIFFTPVSALWMLLSLPIIYGKSARATCYLAVRWNRIFLLFGKIFCGIKIKIEGAELLPADKKYILAAKHSSMWETIFLYQYFNGATFVLKQQLVDTPLIGQVAKNISMIAIERSQGVSAMSKLIKSIKAIKTYPLIIFPQGTRVKQMQDDYNLEKYPYKKGVVAMSKGSGLPVYCMSHNASVYWGRGFFSLKKSGTIVVKFEKYGKVLQSDQDLNEVANIIETTTKQLLQK